MRSAPSTRRFFQKNSATFASSALKPSRRSPLRTHVRSLEEGRRDDVNAERAEHAEILPEELCDLRELRVETVSAFSASHACSAVGGGARRRSGCGLRPGGAGAPSRTRRPRGAAL